MAKRISYLPTPIFPSSFTRREQRKTPREWIEERAVQLYLLILQTQFSLRNTQPSYTLRATQSNSEHPNHRLEVQVARKWYPFGLGVVRNYVVISKWMGGERVEVIIENLTESQQVVPLLEAQRNRQTLPRSKWNHQTMKQSLSEEFEHEVRHSQITLCWLMQNSGSPFTFRARKVNFIQKVTGRLYGQGIETIYWFPMAELSVKNPYPFEIARGTNATDSSSDSWEWQLCSSWMKPHE